MKSPLTLLATALLSFGVSAEPLTLDLWPDKPPGETGSIGAEADITKPTDGLIAGKRLIRLGNVSKPTLTVYKPTGGKDTHAAVLVCPGGAYHILAQDLEGSEICEWLNTQGITGILLKYRVPMRQGREKHAVALEDAQRAMGLTRQHAKEWSLDPARIGVMGFSAGGHLAATVSSSGPERTYPRVDAADDLPSRPDFSMLIYPAYLTVKEQGDKVAPEIKLSTNTPPTFMIITEDDPVRVENVLNYAMALKQYNVPMELHLYPTGGHGYGLRRTSEMVTTWTDRANDWLKQRLP